MLDDFPRFFLSNFHTNVLLDGRTLRRRAGALQMVESPARMDSIRKHVRCIASRRWRGRQHWACVAAPVFTTVLVESFFSRRYSDAVPIRGVSALLPFRRSQWPACEKSALSEALEYSLTARSCRVRHRDRTIIRILRRHYTSLAPVLP